MLDLIKSYCFSKPILGVCLGHQAIGECFGAKLENLSSVYHGISSTIKVLDDKVIYEGMPAEFEVGRYHSWVVSADDLLEEIVVTSVSDDGCIMGLRHREYEVYGVQFHPESILTPFGEQIIHNFLSK